jgi:ABC-type Zn uptake system ZnuABC Zn-binding protein ZnuA
MKRISWASGGLLVLGLLVASAVTACAGAQPLPAASPAGSDRLQVVATTTIAGDVVRQVGGDLIDVHVLLPVGADPHGFQPKPQDIARVAEADMIVVNGAGLEEFLQRMLQSAGGAARTVDLSRDITLRELDASHAGAAAEVHDEAEAEGDQAHEGGDPHVWTDPNNVRQWVATVAAALAEMDSAQAEVYQANAEVYDRELQALDAWIAEQVAQIPEANREMVVDHDVFGYFAGRYGLSTIGTIIPGFSTVAEPSAQELAALEDAIRQMGARAVFVGTTVNPSLARRVADDTGTQLVTVYTGSLGEPDGEAGTYLDYMRYNTRQIVDALK